MNPYMGRGARVHSYWYGNGDDSSDSDSDTDDSEPEVGDTEQPATTESLENSGVENSGVSRGASLLVSGASLNYKPINHRASVSAKDEGLAVTLVLSYYIAKFNEWRYKYLGKRAWMAPVSAAEHDRARLWYQKAADDIRKEASSLRVPRLRVLTIIDGPDHRRSMQSLGDGFVEFADTLIFGLDSGGSVECALVKDAIQEAIDLLTSFGFFGMLDSHIQTMKWRLFNVKFRCMTCLFWFCK